MSNEAEKPISKGCGLLNAVLGTRKLWPRRSTSTGSLPREVDKAQIPNINTPTKIPSVGLNSKRRSGSFDDLNATSLSPPDNPVGPPKAPAHKQQYQYHNGRKLPSDGYKVPGASRSTLVVAPQNQSQSQSQQAQNTRKTVPKETMGISGELEMMLSEHLSNGGGANLVRVSSGNVMVHSSLGNLRQQNTSYTKPVSNGKEEQQRSIRFANTGMGNVVVNKNNTQNNNKQQPKKQNNSNAFCRALSCRMDPEELKIMGNEDYKNGRFAEALALYERAIDLDPTKAAYRSNKSAALAALGRLLEAVIECREAIEIEPHYHRAHHRLANLHLRLGEAEKALYHFKQSGGEADPDAISKAKIVLSHLKKCDDAKRLKDWHTVLRESGNAIACGADFAPMVVALQAEAYLKLHRHHDAAMALENGPNFDTDQFTKFFGPIANASFLVIRAQVHLAAGRFDEAMEATQLAAKLDQSNREVGVVTRRVRAVSSARSQGNDFFKESNFSDASVAYARGLDHDPYNSVLLCNRAACRIKLGQFEKAIEDCSSALNVRPSYTKARLRRAESNVKLQKWEVAVRDYEILLKESPLDEDLGRTLFDAQVQLQKQRGENVSNMKFGSDGVVKIQSSDTFRNSTSWLGLSVAWFCNKPGDKQTVQFMEELSKRYPTVKFVKVEVEDNQSLVKSEGVTSLPLFSIYSSGSKVKELPGDDHEGLEDSINEHAT